MTRGTVFRQFSFCALLVLIAIGGRWTTGDELDAAESTWVQGASSPTLVVAGDVSSPQTLAAADLKAMPRTQVTVQQDGRPVIYEGVLVGEILKRAGAPLGAALRGNALATYVLGVGRDGYQVVFSLAELDSALTSNQIVVADTVDGEPLSDEQGPLRIVTPKDSRPARSVRMLERLQVVRVQQ